MAADLPESILRASEAAMKEIVPAKSSKRYLETYTKFMDWRKGQQAEPFDEEVFLAYFEEVSKRFKPTTLWSTFSMLKATIGNHNIDISRYSRVIAFLKRKNHGFESKRSSVFSAEEIKKFLLDAPDSEFLAVKTVTVFGISGGCRGVEITNVMFCDVTDSGHEIVVRIPESKTYTANIFPIISETSIAIIRRYTALRPPKCPTDRFFILHRGNKCFGQPIGKNTMAQMPQRIARFLNLENPEGYTGHSFRRTSTTISADAGASLDELKRFYYWKSYTVAERYIQDSLGQKRMLAHTITKALDLDPNEAPVEKVSKISSDVAPNIRQERNGETIHMPTINDSAAIFTMQQEANGDVNGANEKHSIALSQTVCNNGKKVERQSVAFSNCRHFTINFGNCSK